MPIEPTMTCRDATALLADYLDEELAFAARASLEAHLAGCVRCVAYFVGYRETRRLVRMVGTALVDDVAARWRGERSV